ncbi:1229_t:CDS:1, partial [Racocetra fulgida]
MSDQTNRHSLSIRSTDSESAEEKNSATLTTFAATEIPEKTHPISDFKEIHDVEGKELRLEDRFVVNFYNTANNSEVEIRDNTETSNTGLSKSTRNVNYRTNSGTSDVNKGCLSRLKPSPQTLSTIIIPIVIVLLGIIMGIAVFFVILGQE